MKKSFKLFAILTILFVSLSLVAFMPAQEPATVPLDGGEGAVCEGYDVKVDAPGTYDGPEATLTITGETVTWSAKPGYEITAVCIKEGGPGGGTLLYPAVGLGVYNKGSYDFSHTAIDVKPVEDPTPVPVENLKLTFMQPCQPVEGLPEQAEWRIRNPNSFPVQYVINKAGTGQILSGEAPAGDSFFYTPWGAQTLTLVWDGGQTTKAGGDSFNGTICETVENLKLTFMQPCQPVEGLPEQAEWRIRNPNSFPVQYSVEKAGTGEILSGQAPTGDSFFYTPWGAQTLILIWDGGQTTKAGGDSFNGTICPVDEPTPTPTPNTPNPPVNTETDTGGMDQLQLLGIFGGLVALAVIVMFAVKVINPKKLPK